MRVEKTVLPGVVVITPDRFGDVRGFFSETWNKARLADAGFSLEFVQDNHSLSAEVGTLRGLHMQIPPKAQAKLVRCGRGRLFDVAVDIRKGSPTFGRWVGVELSFENGKQLLIPAGCLHGFATRDPDTEVIYKCSDFYAPDFERSVRFDDPDIDVDWGLTGDPILSEKDEKAARLVDLDNPFIFEEGA